MSVSLARRLVSEGVVAPEDVNAALRSHVTERVAFLRQLVRQRPDLVQRLEAELGCRASGAPARIVADPKLVSQLPRELPETLLAVPVGRDPQSRAIQVVAADPSDPHVMSELSHHFREAVRVSAAPLSAVLAAFAPSPPPAVADARELTPAFGTSGNAPSEPPIPLVRLSPEGTQSPATVKGVAPQAVGVVHAARVVVPPRAPVQRASEPVIELTRAKASPSSAEASKSAPSNPIPESGPPSAPRVEAALQAFEEAGTPEDVVRALVKGLSTVAARVLVLAARGKVFEGRESNVPSLEQEVRTLVISGDRPSVLVTASQTGHYLGPIPQTLVHTELARLLGDPSDEIAVGVVMVSSRPALAYVMSSMSTTYLATRAGDQLAQAAARALERIVRHRKK
jgi:hypothetical protein